MTALAGVMPGRPSSAAAAGDTRQPATTGDGDAAALTSDFARALSDAGAAGRPTHGAPGRGQDTAARQGTAAASLLHIGRAATPKDEAAPVLPGASPDPDGDTSAGTDRSADTSADTATDAATAAASSTALPGNAADAATLLAELQARHTAQATATLRNETAASTGREPAAPLESEALSETLPPSAPTRSAAAPVLRAAPALPTTATTVETGDHTSGAGPAAPVAPEAVAASGEPQTWQPQAPVQPPPQALALPVQTLAAARREDDLPADAGRPPERAEGATTPISNQRPAAELPSALSTARAASTEDAPPPPIAAVGPAIEPAIAAPSATTPPLPTAAAVAPPSGLAMAPVAEARLSAPPGSAEFASQLGSQLTTFIRNGVQHARLHLNPDEMGPVTVQIRIDGQAAQVHLAAEHGLTRQALEQSMPMLAGSLREAGLTLSGGGVFEQPRQARDQAGAGTAAGSPPGPSGAQGADGPPQQAGVTAPRRRGVVDLVA